MKILGEISTWCFIVLATLLLITTPRAAAVPSEGINLQISPLPIELTANPGSNTTAQLRVENASSETERLQIRLLKVTEDNNGVVHLNNPGPNDEWVHWISFDRTLFDAPSNQWQTITMTVNVPKNAAFGYYFAVAYQRAVDLTAQPGQAVAHGAVATFILLNANAPGAKRDLKIESFSTSHKSYEYLPATFSVKVHSYGNVHAAPIGNIFILKGGKQIDSISINSAGGNVLPGGSRYFNASWSNGFPSYTSEIGANGQPLVDKDGQPKQNLKWDFSQANKLRFGHYTAHLVMVYSNGQRDVPLDASVQFWVIPWKILVGLLFILILVGLGVWTILRRTTLFMRKQTANRRIHKK